MKWLDKILNLSKEPNVYSNFPSLMKIEALPTSQRSSRVLQAKKDLLTLKKEDAINWLAKNITSPATKVWGGLLFDLSADWNCLRGWMDISKLHALAAADAINCYIYNDEKLPVGASKQIFARDKAKLRKLY